MKAGAVRSLILNMMKYVEFNVPLANQAHISQRHKDLQAWHSAESPHGGEGVCLQSTAGSRCRGGKETGGDPKDYTKWRPQNEGRIKSCWKLWDWEKLLTGFGCQVPLLLWEHFSIMSSVRSPSEDWVMGKQGSWVTGPQGKRVGGNARTVVDAMVSPQNEFFPVSKRTSQAGWLWPLRDTQNCLENFCFWHPVEVKATAKHTAIHRTSLAYKELYMLKCQYSSARDKFYSTGIRVFSYGE